MADSQHHTLVCSVLFLDIEGYSKKSVSEQLSIKQQFNTLLAGALRHVAPDDRIILDTGDGAAVSFLSDPEDSLFAAMNLRDAIATTAPTLRVRIGINLGPVRLLKDINGQVNIIGDGINDAQRVMSFCEPGKILVSRPYFEVVSRLSDDYAHLFVYEGTHADKHVREHAVYAIGPSTPEPPHDFASHPEAPKPVPDIQVSAPSPKPAASPPAPEMQHPGGHKTAVIAVAAVLVVFGGAALWLWHGKAPGEVSVPAPDQPVVVPASPASSPEVPPPSHSKKPIELPAPPKKAPEPPPPHSDKPEAHKSPAGSDTFKESASPPAWLIEMRDELSNCRKKGVLERGICKEAIRWKYCNPSHWDKFEECRVSKDGNAHP